MIADGLTDRVGKLVLISCEAFENYPPGIPGRLAWLSAKVPGGIAMMRHALAIRPVRHLPITFGSMSKRGVPEALMDTWLAPLGHREVRPDLIKYAGDSGRGRRAMLAATPALLSFRRPVLVVWASEDRLMPRGHGPRLVAAFPDARLVEIADSYTLVPIDQPALLAEHLRAFVTG